VAERNAIDPRGAEAAHNAGEESSVFAASVPRTEATDSCDALPSQDGGVRSRARCRYRHRPTRRGRSARPSPVASIAIMPEELHGKKLRAIPVARDTWWRLCRTDADWLLPSIAIMPEELHGKKYEQSRLLAILGGDRAGRVPIGCRFASPGGPGPYARL